MKRSEMIKKLGDFMENTEPPDSDLEALSMLLQALENFGMKPPKDGPYSYSTHDWEPEDWYANN